MGEQQDEAAQRGEVKIDDEGTTYSGTYTAAGGMITVESAFGSKSMPLGDHLPEDAARLLLRGLLAMGKKQLD